KPHHRCINTPRRIWFWRRRLRRGEGHVGLRPRQLHIMQWSIEGLNETFHMEPANIIGFDVTESFATKSSPPTRGRPSGRLLIGQRPRRSFKVYSSIFQLVHTWFASKLTSVE